MVHCIAISYWAPRNQRASATLQQLPKTVISARLLSCVLFQYSFIFNSLDSWLLNILLFSFDTNLLVYSVSWLFRVLPIVVSQWAKVPQLAVFMVWFLTDKPSKWILAHSILNVSQISSLKCAQIILFGFVFFMNEEHFLRQFCDAHTCTGSNKPFPRGGKVRSIKPLQLLMCDKWGW